MRIHLLCDHKWRDLPNLTALKVRLEQLGHNVLLSSAKDAQAMMGAFRPDCVVLNHLFSAAHRNLAKNLQASGIAVVVLPTEGAMRPEFKTLGEGEFSDFTLADLFLAWSEPVAEGIRARWGFDAGRVPVAGCNRFDFYDPRFTAAIDSRQTFCVRYGLDLERPIITWATQYGYAHLAAETTSSRYQQWLREIADVGVLTAYQRIGLDPCEVPHLYAKGRDAAAHAFFTLARAVPEVQFLIKPHPIEDLDYYRQRIIAADLHNVRFCPTDYIWNVLKVSDIELHRQCTTAVEDWMWGKPTIEMGMDFVPQWAWKEREDGSDVARDTEELIALVRGYLRGRLVEDHRQAYRRAYIQRWFGPVDGRRCSATGDLIDVFLKARGKRRGYLHPIKGLPVSPRGSLTAVLRYRLDRLPNQPFLRPTTVAKDAVGYDKLIVRSDVIDYRRRIADAVG